MIRCPEFSFVGEPIRIDFRPRLRAHRGKLLSGESRGGEVHAASFLRDRLIVLDSALLRDRAERDRILAHEIAHFIWWKAGAARRANYVELITAELHSEITGEMGWSAEWRKKALHAADSALCTRRFREYLAESFCDTAAALICSLQLHEEITLPYPARRRRLAWMGNFLNRSALRI